MRASLPLPSTLRGATLRSCVIFSAKACVLAKTTVVRLPSMIRRRRRISRR